ncbi:MAG: hypothetical protein LLG04_17915 [Parachlamydia sp.]|nr:hypothetical protein [Parachlamydia sp.]
MKISFLPLIMMLLTQSCAPALSKQTVWAYRFMGDFAKQQQQENGFFAYGVGSSMPKGKLKTICLDFVSTGKLKLDEARVAYINLTQQMLLQVNADDSLRNYLDHYPFTEADIEISLAFEEESGKDVEPPSIAAVSLTRGIIHYVWYDASTERFFKERITEPYEEALHIVRSEGKVSGLNLSCSQ